MKTKIESANAPAAIGPYSQAVKVGNFIFASGQIPINPATGKVVEGGIREQVEQVLKNVGAVLAEAGCTYDNVVKTTVFLQDMGDFATMNELYGKAFSSAIKPARSAVQVAKLPMGVLVEIEVIAAL